MNRLIILFACLVASAYCAEELVLHPICKNDTFDFEGRNVNSFFAIQLNYSLPKPEYLQLADRLNKEFERWTTNATELKQLIGIKDQFNRIVSNFYQQDKINDKQLYTRDILITRKVILDIREYFQSWYSRIGFGEKIAWHIVMNVIAKTNEFLTNLFNVKNGKLNEKIVPEEFMVYLQIYLGENLKPGQWVAFINHEKFYYYNYIERILRFDNVTIGANDTQLFSSVVIPISDGYKPTGTNCTSASELPPFYSEYLV